MNLLQIIDLQAGKPFTHFDIRFHDNVWHSVQAACSDQYDCAPEDIDTFEGEDGCELITARGELVAEMRFA